MHEVQSAAAGTAAHRAANGSPAAVEPIIDAAVIGSGPMGRQHAAAIARSNVPARVVAVADPDVTARETLLESCPGATGFATLAEILEHVRPRVRPTVIHVCTPPSTHEALAEEALHAGCHVYIEKPFATSEGAAARLLELAERSGLRAMAGHQLVFERPFRALVGRLPALRRVVHVESYFSFRPARGGKLLRSDEQLVDVLPHPVYLLVETLAAAGEGGRAELTRIELGSGGTVHALVRCGEITATLVVTLEGRPVESYLRVVGTNGSLHADFVRGTVQEHLGPGHSGVDKALHPYRTAWQLGRGTTAALARRLRRRELSYPGLSAAIDAFYRSLVGGKDVASPIAARQILATTAICEAITEEIARSRPQPVPTVPAMTGMRVAVTGGTGLLGAATARELLRRGAVPLSISRRQPAAWERVPDVAYGSHDLSRPLQPEAFQGADVVVHCAAATAGGWDEHRRHSVDATEHVFRAAAAAGVRRIVHVSSTAVLAQPPRGEPLTESSPLVSDPGGAGAYVHGKLVSEQVATRLAAELGLELRIIRPGPIVDRQTFDPPGRLGRRLGNWFIAVGRPGERMGVVDLDFAAAALAWMALEDDAAPPLLNLITPDPPTRRELVEWLRRDNPRLRVLWAPRGIIAPALNLAGTLNRLIRSGGTRVDAREIFGHRDWDTTLVAQLENRIRPAPGDESVNRPRQAVALG